MIQCATYHKTKIENQQKVIGGLTGLILATFLYILAGCGNSESPIDSIIPETATIDETPLTIEPTSIPTETPQVEPTVVPTVIPTFLATLRWARETTVGSCAYNNTTESCAVTDTFEQTRFEALFAAYNSCLWTTVGDSYVIDCSSCTHHSATCGAHVTYQQYECVAPIHTASCNLWFF